MLPDVNNKPERQLIIKMAGYLEKKGRMRVVGVRRWKKRWCVLEGKLLLYFKTQLEYSHHLSPCRGSVNMGLVLSVTPRGPCQLQIVTRSQIIIFRTKSKTDQDDWFAALRDAKNNNPQCFVGQKPSHDRMSAVESRFTNHGNGIVRENYRLRGQCGKPTKESFDGVFYEVANGRHGADRATATRSTALRKSESDNRIGFYRENTHGRQSRSRKTRPAFASPAAGSDKESCGRSRSLSYESIYFKPQEKCQLQSAVAVAGPAAKSQSCRELAPDVAGREPDMPPTAAVSKRMSRSASFFQRRCGDDSDESDDYDYVDVDAARMRSKPMAHIEESEQQYPELPPPRPAGNDGEMASTPSPEDFDDDDGGADPEADVDVIYYVNNDRKMNMFTNELEPVLGPPEGGAERTAGADDERTAGADDEQPDDEPPPLPMKNRSKRDAAAVPEEERPRRTADGVYVFKNGTREVVYDVPIPHGKLIEHFRRLTVTPPSPVKRHADIVYDDSLEPSVYETLHMTPDSLEIATIFPEYKRWSKDSGFNNYYEEPSPFPADRTSHYDDSLEPVIAMLHRDRKIWQNVPNISSTDYFR